MTVNSQDRKGGSEAPLEKVLASALWPQLGGKLGFGRCELRMLLWSACYYGLRVTAL